MINTHGIIIIDMYKSINTCIEQWHIHKFMYFLWNALWKNSAKLSFPVLCMCISNYLKFLWQVCISFVTTISIVSLWSILSSLWSTVSSLWSTLWTNASSDGRTINLLSFFWCETFSSNETNKINSWYLITYK